jgi:hypothetical protein
MRLSTKMLHAMSEELPRIRDELDRLKRGNGTPSDSPEIPYGDGSSQALPETDTALRSISLMTDEELDSEANDPAKRMRALVKGELIAGHLAERAAMGGKYHWAKQFMEHQRRCGDTLQKLRREAQLKSKSLPADWDNLRRWVIYDLKKHPEALEAFYSRMDQYEEGKLPRFEPGREENEKEAVDGI